MRKLLLLLTFSAVAGFAGPIAGGSCGGGGTLAQFIAVGATGCDTATGLHLYNFAYAYSSTGADVLASSVVLTAVQDSPALTYYGITGAWDISGASGSMTLEFSFDYTTPAPLVGPNQYVYYSAMSGFGAPNISPLDGSITTVDGTVLASSHPSAFSATGHSINGHVPLSVALTTGGGGEANLSGIIFAYAAPTPEPATLALSGLALLALGALRRYRI